MENQVGNAVNQGGNAGNQGGNARYLGGNDENQGGNLGNVGNQGVLQKRSKFTGDHPCRSVMSIKLHSKNSSMNLHF